jgi:hypothetical protein
MVVDLDDVGVQTVGRRTLEDHRLKIIDSRSVDGRRVLLVSGSGEDLWSLRHAISRRAVSLCTVVTNDLTRRAEVKARANGLLTVVNQLDRQLNPPLPITKHVTFKKMQTA